MSGISLTSASSKRFLHCFHGIFGMVHDRVNLSYNGSTDQQVLELVTIRFSPQFGQPVQRPALEWVKVLDQLEHIQNL